MTGFRSARYQVSQLWSPTCLCQRVLGPTPCHPSNVPINCRDFGMVCLGAVCSSVGAAGRAYNLRGAIPVIAPLFTFIVKHYANDVPVTLATFQRSGARSGGFPDQTVIVCVIMLSSIIIIICHHGVYSTICNKLFWQFHTLVPTYNTSFKRQSESLEVPDLL